MEFSFDSAKSALKPVVQMKVWVSAVKYPVRCGGRNILISYGVASAEFTDTVLLTFAFRS
jgi:hypothetical protein